MVHVSLKSDNGTFVCANGSGCARFRVKVSKKRTTASLCPHEHIVVLVTDTNTKNTDESSDKHNDDKTFGNHVWLENTSKYLYKHRQLDLSDANIKHLEQRVMERNKLDAWPKVYQVIRLPGTEHSVNTVFPFIFSIKHMCIYTLNFSLAWRCARCVARVLALQSGTPE